MRIAIIHNEGSVGSWRWVFSVFGAIKKYYKDISITIFYKENAALPNDLMQIISTLGINIEPLPVLHNICIRQKYTQIRCLDNLIHHIKKHINKVNQKKFITLVNQNYDIVFNSWPYTITPVKFSIPSFFIPHDFIFTHFFGFHVGNIYNYEWYTSNKQTLQKFLDFGYIPVVTSKFIKQEFINTFPEYSGKIYQIMTVMTNYNKSISNNEETDILKKFGILKDYILYPTNDMHHKNMSEVLTAYYYVKQKFPDLKMIIIGLGTQGIHIKMNTPYYGDHTNPNSDYDIKSLGLVSDKELMVLLKNSKLVVNASLCEAACGSGADAWYVGVPTAISDIPCYKEQVDVYGVKTEFFNPKNSEDIAAAMLRILENPEQATQYAAISKNAIKTHYTDKIVADKYVKMFSEYVT